MVSSCIAGAVSASARQQCKAVHRAALAAPSGDGKLSEATGSGASMPKKTVQEFKEIFGGIKKPKLPKGISSKDKDALEKDLNNEDMVKFVNDAQKLYQADEGYLAKLVAYKVKKHFDNDDKRPAWLENVPQKVRDAAVKLIVPGDINDPVTRRAYDKAVAQDNFKVIALLKERDRNGVDALEDARALAKKKSEVVDKLKTGNEKDAKDLGAFTLSWLPPDDVAEIAEANPKLFFETVLPSFKDNAQFVKYLANETLREKLKKVDPAAWKKFETDTPMLATLAKAEQKVKEKGLTDTASIMEEVFAAVLDPSVMPLGYAATALDPNNTILSGPTEKSATFRKEQAEQKEEGGDIMPDTPATDCHHLLYITEDMMKMFPGIKKPQIVNQSCPKMLMTRPLSKIPGRGLLDRSFTGNVYDESRKATGMVLFTGDNGINSHTWLLVDTVPFDPVLGTKGDDVEGAVQEKFDWVIPQRLAKGEKGSFAIQDGTLKPATNAMGFSTGYIVTNTPKSYLNEDEQKQAGLT
jgi:hypothetical protein